MPENVHVTECNEGDRVMMDGREVTFLNAWRQTVLLGCECCSDYTDHFYVSYQVDGDPFSDENLVEYGEIVRVSTIDGR